MPPLERALSVMADLQVPEQVERGQRLVRWLGLTSPQLLTEHRLLKTLARLPWPNAPRRLPRTGVNTPGKLVGLLIARYALPPVLRTPFQKPHVGRYGRLVFGRLACHVGVGGALRQALDQGLVPPHTTRRLYRTFLAQSGPPRLAWVRAQAAVVGASPDLATLVHRHVPHHPRRAEDFWQDDAFWMRALQWMGRQPFEHPVQAQEIIDYLVHHRIDLAGRTLASVQRRVDDWHQSLRIQRRRPPDTSPFPRPEYGHDVALDLGPWTVCWLPDSAELYLEGQAMRHCVYSYARRAAQGQLSIWSVRCDGRRVLTLEVRSRTREVVQIRGERNRPATPQERQVVLRWARANRCRVV